MEIKSVLLNGFRGYLSSAAHFSSGTNMVYGLNAQGKTNLLEAIYFASMMRSFRNVQEKELIHFDREKAVIQVRYLLEEREFVEEIRLERGKEKQVFLNGIKVSQYKEMRDYLKVVFFCPEELEIIKGGPEKRREFIDTVIGVLKPSYQKVLSQYYLALKQKNSLLKKIRREKRGKELLPIWEDRVAEYGASIMWYRSSFLEKFKEMAKKAHKEITEGKEVLDMIYVPSVKTEDLKKREEIKKEFLKKQEDTIYEEIEREMSLIGPHRDDIETNINEKDTKKYGSQGQQRSAVLSMKLAQMEMIKEIYSEYPVLLLDDIMSELDEKRREFLKGKIKGKQVILTCTDKDDFKEDEQKRSFMIQGGTIRCTSILEGSN